LFLEGYPIPHGFPGWLKLKALDMVVTQNRVLKVFLNSRMLWYLEF
jgi:hypothetical protein